MAKNPLHYTSVATAPSGRSPGQPPLAAHKNLLRDGSTFKNSYLGSSAFLEELEQLSSGMRREEMGRRTMERLAYKAGMAVERVSVMISSAVEMIFPVTRMIYKVRHVFGQGVATFYDLCAWTAKINFLVFWIWFILVLIPWYVAHDEEGMKLDWMDTLKNFVGYRGGVVTDDSWWYYSGYKASMGRFRIDVQYTCAVLATLGLHYVFIIRKIGANIGRVTMASYDVNLQVVLRLYSYDMGLRNPLAVKLLLGGMYNEIKSVHDHHLHRGRLKSLEIEAATKGFCCSRKCYTYCKRLIGAVLTLVVLVSSNVALYIIMENEDYLNSKMAYATTLCVSALMIPAPHLISWIVHFEGWLSPLTVLYNCVGRTYFIKMTLVGLLTVRIYSRARNDPTRCVETEAGSLLLQLLYSDLSSQMLGLLLSQMASHIWRRAKGWQPAEFDLSNSMLEIMYSQSIVWLGSAVCPMMLGMGAMLLTLRLVIRYLVMMAANQPPARQFRTGENAHFFHSILLLTLVLSSVPVCYFLQRDSRACGPHINSTAIDGLDFFTTELGTFSDILSWTTSSLSLFFVLVVLLTHLFLLERKVGRQMGMEKIRYEQKTQEARALKRLLQICIMANQKRRASVTPAPQPPLAPRRDRSASIQETSIRITQPTEAPLSTVIASHLERRSQALLSELSGEAYGEVERVVTVTSSELDGHQQMQRSPADEEYGVS